MEGNVNNQTPNWYDSLNLTDESKGMIEVKGFKDPNDLIKSYRNIESLVGVDKNDIIRIPKAAEGEEPDYTEVFKRLGRPDSGADYELGDSDFAKAAAEEMLKIGLSKKQAKALDGWLSEYNKSYMQTKEEQFAAEQKAKMDESISALQKSWGAKYDENLQVAKNAVADAAKSFGLTSDALDKIGDVIGIEMAAKLFYALGSAQPGDGSKNIQNYSSHAGNETPEIAQFKLAEMYSDPETAKRIAAGDKKTFTELNRLNAIVAKSKFVGGNN